MANEKRLISLDDALAATHKEVFWTESRAADVRAFLIQQPKVDAVEVVRCKDCKWWHDMKCTNINGAHCLVINENWFCCSGERKDDV